MYPRATSRPPRSGWCCWRRTYPLGSVKVCPAREGGIAATFPHQARNVLHGHEERPWRTGVPCLDSSLATLGTIAGETEPSDADRRLLWRVQRLVIWCRRAATGTLQAAGDPFELPELPPPPADASRVAFLEDAVSFGTWSGVAYARCGSFDWSRVDDWIVVRRFVTDRRAVVGDAKWGSWLPEKATVYRGAWALLPSFPTVHPWGAPSTWGELRTAAKAAGADLDVLVPRALDIVRHEPESLLLLGHPMPSKVGGSMAEINWLALELECWNEETPTRPSRAAAADTGPEHRRHPAFATARGTSGHTTARRRFATRSRSYGAPARIFPKIAYARVGRWRAAWRAVAFFS